MIMDLFEATSKKMQIDFQSVTSRISHQGEKGTARENVLMQYLRPYIPEKYSFSKGIIIDSHDIQSRQVDIIIHDRNLTPYLQDQDTTKIIPIESVYGVIEVKSKLTKEELQKCINNIESVRSLTKNTINGISCPTAGFVFAYDSDSSLETILKNLTELSMNLTPEKKICCICVLNKGLIVLVNKFELSRIMLFPSTETIYVIHNNENNSLLMFYLLLFQTLNSISVFPPNMIAYANSTGDLNTQLFIPKEFIPADAAHFVLTGMMSIAEINKIKEYSKRFFSGKLSEKDFLECEFGILIPLLRQLHGTLDNIPENEVINFFDVEIKRKEIIQMYNIFNNRESADESQMAQLNSFTKKMYNIYDSHRQEMLKNSQNET